jgi:hypothetical protein
MHSLLPHYLAKLRFNAQQLATLHALGEYRGKQALYVAQSPEMLSDLRQVAVVESTESCNRLAGGHCRPVRTAGMRASTTSPRGSTISGAQCPMETN